VKRAATAATPYTATFTKQVYHPYLRPALEYVIPGAAFLHTEPRSFWSIISDFLPSAGATGHVAENKGYNKQAQKGVKSASVSVAKAQPTAKANGKGKMDRAEMEKAREAIRSRVKEQGQKGYDKIHAEVN
jgi:hypothetical protein